MYKIDMGLGNKLRERDLRAIKKYIKTHKGMMMWGILLRMYLTSMMLN